MATSAQQWKQGRSTELELPSGNTALVRRPGPELLLRKGVLPDSMRPMVTQMIKSGQGIRKEDASKMAENPEMLVGMMDVMDRVLCQTVVEPHVRYQRGVRTDRIDKDGFVIFELSSKDEENEDIPEEDRNPEVLYADDVDFDDKQFIFQFVVGGTRDIARFREQSSVSLGDVSDGEVDELPTERTT